ncbi:hypothetical protein Tco_1261189 [Tanacetum coccineum]
MGGVCGYELPTSQGLGGIVFESGPKSRNDYDVIIEARGGPPQRINKLHQSFMYLQFPLLFVYAMLGRNGRLEVGEGRSTVSTVAKLYEWEDSRILAVDFLIMQSWRFSRLYSQYSMLVNRLLGQLIHESLLRPAVFPRVVPIFMVKSVAWTLRVANAICIRCVLLKRGDDEFECVGRAT